MLPVHDRARTPVARLTGPRDGPKLAAMRPLATLAPALALIAALASVAGCGAANDRPPTPEEKAQLLREAQTKQLHREMRPDRCDRSTPAEQIDARQDNFRGAAGFDSRGCAGPSP